MDSTPAASSLSVAASTLAGSSGRTTRPRWSMRSETSWRSRRGASGGGLSQSMSYRRG